MTARQATRHRWGDNDRNLGPFTYAYDPKYWHWAVVLKADVSEDTDCETCSLRISLGPRTLIIGLPRIVRPAVTRRYPGWDQATVERLGRAYYDIAHERVFGFSYGDGFLQVFRGLRTHDSSTDRTWSCFLPWTQWRHVRRSFYDLEGRHFWSEIDAETQAVRKLGDQARNERYDIVRSWEALCPTITFRFLDFDGEQLTATTKIEEREWLFGTGWFEWLSLYRRPKIVRSLDITFSGETGKRKGSWKGGTVGHSITMLPGEFHCAAFQRYCKEHDMTFVEG